MKYCVVIQREFHIPLCYLKPYMVVQCGVPVGGRLLSACDDLQALLSAEGRAHCHLPKSETIARVVVELLEVEVEFVDVGGVHG